MRFKAKITELTTQNNKQVFIFVMIQISWIFFYSYNK